MLGFSQCCRALQMLFAIETQWGAHCLEVPREQHGFVLSRQAEQALVALLLHVLVLCPGPLLQFAVNSHVRNPVDVCTGCLICLFLIVGLQRLPSQTSASGAIVRNKSKLS